MATPKKTVKKTPKKKADTDVKADHPVHLINTANAAQSAAAALVARAKGVSPPKTAAAETESAAFKKLKQGLAQPQHSATSPLAGGNKFSPGGQSGGFVRQVGQSQNSGANFNRTGVPRRTSGG